MVPISAALSATNLRMERRSSRSSSRRPLSSATRKATVSTASWMSLRLSMRASSSGPTSDAVVRTGWPCSPNTSQNIAGEPSNGQGERPSCATRSSTLALPPPGWVMPERSPLMSAAKTGTPARLNASASTCRVTVLPVPVAPATRPCRLAMLGSRYRSAAFLAISRPSAVSVTARSFPGERSRHEDIRGAAAAVGVVRHTVAARRRPEEAPRRPPAARPPCPSGLRSGPSRAPAPSGCRSRSRSAPRRRRGGTPRRSARADGR